MLNRATEYMRQHDRMQMITNEEKRNTCAFIHACAVFTHITHRRNCSPTNSGFQGTAE